MVITESEKLKEVLFELYVVEKLSVNKIAKKLNSSYGVIYRRLKKFEIPLRGKTDYPNPFLGKKHSDASKEKMSKAKKGKKIGPMPAETKKKISKATKGVIRSKKTKKKISKNHSDVSGSNNPMWGKRHSKETKKKISKAIKGKLRTGNKHHWYKGPGNRKTDLSKLIRTCSQYLTWRKTVYVRDNYTCQLCNARSKRNKSIYLNADHIKSFSTIIKENNIQTLEQALVCKELWDVDNGRTLCLECHKKTSTYGVG